MHILNIKEDKNSLPLLAKWHQDEWCFLEPTNTLQDRIVKMERCLGNNFIPSIYIAKEENVLLGSAAIIKHDMDTRLDLSPWLAGVYVSEDNRKKGIGSKLVLYVMEQALEHGLETLYLYTLKHSDFYRKLGWSIMQETEYKECLVTIMSFDLHGLRK